MNTFSKAIILATLIMSSASFASNKCKIGFKGQLFHKTISTEKDQDVGYIEGLTIASFRVREGSDWVSDGKVEFVLNGVMKCSEDKGCIVSGTLGQLFIPDSNSGREAGLMGSYRINGGGIDNSSVHLGEGSELKIRCN